jgi:hypothetical protein
MRFLLLIVLFVFAAPISTGLAETVRSPICKMLPSNSSLTSSSDYVSGVSINGKPMAASDITLPATTNSETNFNVVPDVVRIPVSIDFVEQVTQTLPDGLELDAGLSFVEISKDGKVSIDGQDVTSSTKAYCKSMHSAVRLNGKKLNKSSAPEPQKAEQVLKQRDDTKIFGSGT